MITKIKNKITEIRKKDSSDFKKISVIKYSDPLTARIIACAYKVQSDLGPGFNERIYHTVFKEE